MAAAVVVEILTRATEEVLVTGVGCWWDEKRVKAVWEFSRLCVGIKSIIK